MKIKTAVPFALLLVFIAGCSPAVDNINSFDECAAAGNPVMESNPEKCRTADGKVFTRDTTWRNDGVTLLKTPEGNLQCFGCGASMCVDPISGLEEIPETEAQHCTDTFEITGESK